MFILIHFITRWKHEKDSRYDTPIGADERSDNRTCTEGPAGLGAPKEERKIYEDPFINNHN